MPTRILFLTAQLQPFLLSGIQSLLRLYDVEVLVYSEDIAINSKLEMPVNKAFRIVYYSASPKVSFYNEIKLYSPDIVFCAGWMFKLYLKWCKQLKKNGTLTICAMDTQWKGTLKQKFLVFISSFVLKNTFTHAWVPGKRQADYALKLGFNNEQILNNLYAPNTTLFASIFDAKSSKKSFKKFLYVGRLEPHKLLNLLKAFAELSIEERHDWEFHIVGNGTMKKHPLMHHSSVFCHSFLTQNQLLNFAAISSVFCLCSVHEPWGTVVQEFSAAGLPLLVSKQCGSSEFFLNKNGVICDGEDVSDIKNCLLKFISFSENEFDKMSVQSHLLGMSSNSDTWAKTIMQLQ